MVVMGKKMSDEEYSQEDLDILLPLSRALGIAISNADLFREYSMAQAKAAESEKMAAIGTLAASMAHEIRNPVTTIKIFSEYAPSKMNDPDFRNKYKNMVIKEVDKIDHIIQTLIDFSDSNTSIEKERVSLGSAIDDLISSGCVSDDAKKNIKFLANIPATLPDISFNRKELEEILLNLCQNASHAITDKGAIIFTAVEKEETVELRIMDTGCGMPEDLMENIFLPFFTTRSKGFGLGLFVVKELMIRNGGRISVVSRLGEGTTFTLEFAIAS
jgi:signal transduction histidine kinase